MKNFTGVTLFSGGGLCEAALPFVEWVGAIEYDSRIAHHHTIAHPDTPVLVADVADVDYTQFAGVDYLHASPSCVGASVANANKGEKEGDISSARAVCRALREIKPRVFTIENVRGYQEFQSFFLIIGTLANLGYTFDYAVYNAADYSTPQTRQRLYIRAWKEGRLPEMVPTHQERGRLEKSTGSLFEDARLPWNGWYAAIEDLIPTLPDTTFAPWQLERLSAKFPDGISESLLGRGSKFGPEERGHGFYKGSVPSPTILTGMPASRAFLYNPSHDDDMRQPDQPSATVTAEWGGKVRAFLVEGDAAGDRCPTIASPGDPAFTIKSSGGGRVHRAFLLNGIPDNYEGELTPTPCGMECRTVSASADKHPMRTFLFAQTSSMEIRPDADPSATVSAGRRNHSNRAWLECGRVVRITPRCLARWQDLPDTYPLTEKTGLATTIIGNGIAGNLQRAIALPLLRGGIK